MSKIFALALILFFLSSISTCPLEDESCDEHHFRNFKSKYGFDYLDNGENELRLSVFKENLRTIRKLNSEPGQTAKFVINKFAALTPVEFQNQYLGGVNFDYSMSQPNYVNLTSKKVPREFDWRKKGIISDPKSQGHCGSCWAFAAIGVLEAQLALKGYGMIDLSEQDLLDCVYSYGHNCSGEGGQPKYALEYIRDHGYHTERQYPYDSKHPKQGKCRHDKMTTYKAHIESVEFVEGDESKLRNFLIEKGPFSFGMLVPKNIQFYGGGVLKDNTECGIGHTMVMVGYGYKNKMPVWIAKNSWGTDGEDHGFLIFERGVNLCGFPLSAEVPILKKKAD